jgi:lathosterol oxidase
MGSGIDWAALFRYVGFSLVGGVGFYGLVGVIFELRYYRRPDQAHEWKCQPRRWSSPKARRTEILLGGANVAWASAASGVLVYYVSRGGWTLLYSSPDAHAWLYTGLSTVGYFFATDLGLYWAHRLYHTRRLYRLIHHVHHRWTAPTAFTAMAMHPIEIATYHTIMVFPLFVVPLHAYGVLTVVALTQFIALIDHSGVRCRSFLPLVAPTMFHDDHHAHFHVNYGQNLFVWDRLFGTMRRQGRRYGVEVFGGQGTAANDNAPARLWDYSRNAVNDAD